MFDKILSKTLVKDLLHEVIRDERFTSTKDGAPENFGIENFYGLLIVMDAIYKYSIIINNDAYFEEYIVQLRRMLKRLDNHKDLENGVNRLIIKFTAKVLNIEDTKDADSKRDILSYIYNKYIVDGYVFYGFNSSMKDGFSNGIDARKIDIPIERLRQINHFFNNRGFINYIDVNDGDDNYIVLTDNFALAYFYAMSSPTYLKDICCNDRYMNEKEYDLMAFYRGDYEKARENIIKFSHEVRLSLHEGEVMLEAFTNMWNKLNITNAKSSVAFIKRKVVGRNYLKNIRDIFASLDDEKLSVLVGKIFENKDNFYKRYSPVLKDDFTILDLYSYRELYNTDEELLFREESNVLLNDKYFDDLEDEYSVTSLSSLVNNYGKSTILGLVGMLMITIGAALIIFLTYYS